jgi:frataxin-like iron-binding protein CyaY
MDLRRAKEMEKEKLSTLSKKVVKSLQDRLDEFEHRFDKDLEDEILVLQKINELNPRAEVVDTLQF